MARPLRIEYPGAVYHLTSRGNRKEPIFLNDEDRQGFVEILEKTIRKYNWLCHAYCLMNNHYHLLVETPDPNLSLGMRQVNGVYTQRFNRVHQKSGHLFQGRFASVLVEKDSHLLELCRYLVLNPIRAGIVDYPQDWKWSSYGATACARIAKPDFLTIDWILTHFGQDKKTARSKYRAFVRNGLSVSESPWNKVVGQIFFGSQKFVDELQTLTENREELIEIPKKQRIAGRPKLVGLFENKKAVKDKTFRNRQIFIAHVSYCYTLKEIANFLGMHYSTVSKIVKNQ